jgi:hypothetical protein
MAVDLAVSRPSGPIGWSSMSWLTEGQRAVLTIDACSAVYVAGADVAPSCVKRNETRMRELAR